MTDDFVGRLRATRDIGDVSRSFPMNPDGEEAAARIEALQGALATVVVNLQRHHPEAHGPVPAVIAFSRAILRGETLIEAVAAGDAALTPEAPHAD